MKLRAFFVFISLLFSLSGCHLTPEEKLKKIAYETGLDFPTNSIVVHFHETRTFLDPAWVAKIIVPNTSTNTLVESIKEKHLMKRISYDESPPPGSTNWFRTAKASPSEYVDWWTFENTLFEQYYWEYSKEGGRSFVHIIFSNEKEDSTAVFIDLAIF